MPLLAATAEQLSNNFLEAGIIQEIISKDPMFALLPFMQVNSKAYVYNREQTLPSVDWLQPGDTVNESAAQFEEITVTLKALIGDVDVDNFLRETMGDTNDQLAIQIAQKAKAVNRAFHLCLAQGSSSANAKQFDGLPNVNTDATMSIVAGANGSAISLSMLDELADMVPLGADAYVMTRNTRRAVIQAMRLSGGTNAEMLQLENFDGSPIPAVNGIPILINDYLSTTETCGSSNTTASVYAVRLNEVDGLHGIYGGPTGGVRVEEVGTVQDMDATRVRLKWYCGLALKSTKSLARLSGVLVQ